MIDTRDKRASSVRMMRPWLLALPLADGAIGQGDREHTAFGYAGILSGAFVTPPLGNIVGIQLAAPNIVGIQLGAPNIVGREPV